MSRQHEAVFNLAQAYMRGRMGRRAFIRRAIALGLSLPTITAFIAACGGGDDDDDGGNGANTPEPSGAGASTPTAGNSAAGGASTSSSGSGQGGTLIVDTGSQPENLDPHQQLAYTTALINEQICEPLLYYESGALTIVPRLAEAFEPSEDGTEWVFTLRQGVKFHDGTDFNAEAVKFSFDRQLNPDAPTYNPRLGSMVEEIRVESDNVVTFFLTEPNNAFIDVMAGSLVVSQAAVEKFGDAFLENPVGTGPYRFNRWDQGQQVVLDRNDDYWGGTPALDQVVWRWITEDGARLAALLSGEVHMSVDVSPEIAEQLEGTDTHSVISGSTGSLWFLAMNVESEPFQDVKVRQATNFAVDKQTIVEDVLKNTVDIAHGPLGPVWEVYNPAVEEYYSYDPEQARTLLEEAGWSSEREVIFRASIGGSGMLQPEEMATVIQDNLRDVGMNTELEVREFVAWMDAIRNPQNELTIMSWNLPPTEPDFMLTGILGESSFPPGFNTSYWTAAEYESLMEVGRTSTDPDEVRDAYMRAQVIVMDEAPIVPVCHARQVFGVSNRVQNFKAVPSMSFEITNVWVEE